MSDSESESDFAWMISFGGTLNGNSAWSKRFFNNMVISFLSDLNITFAEYGYSRTEPLLLLTSTCAPRRGAA